jgi:hypothetical protein
MTNHGTPVVRATSRQTLRRADQCRKPDQRRGGVNDFDVCGFFQQFPDNICSQEENANWISGNQSSVAIPRKANGSRAAAWT